MPVRRKQARRLIAATLQNTEPEKIFFFFVVVIVFLPNLSVAPSFFHFFASHCLDKSADMGLLLSFFPLPQPPPHTPLLKSSQMARRQTSQGRPMKTSISLRARSNYTWGTCPFPSLRTTLIRGSSRLQVSETEQFLTLMIGIDWHLQWNQVVIDLSEWSSKPAEEQWSSPVRSGRTSRQVT